MPTAPAKLPRDEIAARRVWAAKMLDRAGRGDSEGDYRRAWLLTALLEDYFACNGLWYEGPKASLAWLAAREPALFRLYEDALRPAAGLAAIAALVEAVTATYPP